MGPYAQQRERVDWQVEAQRTPLPPRVLSYPGDSQRPQPYYEQPHMVDSYNVSFSRGQSWHSGHSFCPHSSYSGSTTVATTLGQYWSRPQKRHHRLHILTASSYHDKIINGNHIFSPFPESSDTNKNLETDEQFVKRIANMVGMSNSEKRVATDIASLQPGKVYRVKGNMPKKRIHDSGQDLQFVLDSQKVEDLPRSTSREGTSALAQGIPSTSASSVNDEVKRTLFTYKTWISSENKWRPTKIYKANALDNGPSGATAIQYFHIPLSRGGKLNIFPNVIDPKRVNQVKNELLESKFWRKYSIQGGDEPRLHFLAHEDATDGFEEKTQPGYRYANITMKARPLSSVPKLQQLSKDLADLRKIPDGKWNIGIHPVLYRDNKDSMGDHADDDQGETRIFCILLDSPPTPRKVVVKVFDKLTGGKRERDRVHQEGDEFIELRLRPGDAYEMDGIMQKSYSHCVPKDNENANDKQNRRICVVLRTGDQKYFDKDTGEACVDLAPRPKMKYSYGHIAGLQEGKMYTRRELKRMNAFQLPQRGISGSYDSGADAIIVSGKRAGSDTIENLRYVAEWRIGGNSLVISFLKQSLVRVFRSSKYLRGHEFGGADKPLHRNCTSASYRYDGLYRIVHMQAPTDPLGAFEFYLRRVSCGSSASMEFNPPKPPFQFVPKPSFEDTANAFSRNDRKRRSLSADHSRKQTKWARAIGAKGFSCCANLLLLGKQS